MKKVEIKTKEAFLIWAGMLFLAYLFTGLTSNAQFAAYALWSTAGLTAYTGKRLFQKKKEFNNDETK